MCCLGRGIKKIMQCNIHTCSLAQIVPYMPVISKKKKLEGQLGATLRGRVQGRRGKGWKEKGAV